MACAVREKHQTILTVVGCVIIVMPGSFDSYWGSMSVYLLSFVVTRLDPDSHGQISLTLSLFYIFWTLGFILSSFLSRHVGRMPILVAGSLLANVGIFAGYFAIQSSFLLFNVVFGAVSNFGFGLIYGNAIQLVILMTDKHIGMFSSLLMAHSSLGSLIVIQLTTWYANPRNETPNWILGATRYFTQKDVIDRVPSMLLVLGGYTLTAHGAALMLMNIKPMVVSAVTCYRSLTKTPEKIGLNENKRSPRKTYGDISQKKHDGDDSTTSNERRNSRKNDESESGVNNWGDTREHNKVLSKEIVGDCSGTRSTGDSSYSNNNHTGDSISINHIKDYTPTEMLKTGTFYAILFSFVITNYSSFLIINFYKLFGQMWIHDDHFLTNMGTTLVLSMALIRFMNGIVLDRFGPKKCMVYLISMISLLATWIYFTAMTDRWLYFIVTVMYGSVDGSLFSSYFAVITLLFGKTNMASNVGILLSSLIVMNMVAPSVINAILSLHLGWFALFAGAGGMNVLALLLIIKFLS